MRTVLCPTCGKPHAKGEMCPRCKAAPNSTRGGGKRSKEAERSRKTANPWRSEYSTKAYRSARQAVLERTGGRCAVSGAMIADKVNGRWVMRGNGGVHHIVPLSQGGSNEPSNLVPLETGVHNRIEAERRRRCR